MYARLLLSCGWFDRWESDGPRFDSEAIDPSREDVKEGGPGPDAPGLVAASGKSLGQGQGQGRDSQRAKGLEEDLDGALAK